MFWKPMVTHVYNTSIWVASPPPRWWCELKLTYLNIHWNVIHKCEKGLFSYFIFVFANFVTINHLAFFRVLKSFKLPSPTQQKLFVHVPLDFLGPLYDVPARSTQKEAHGQNPTHRIYTSSSIYIISLLCKNGVHFINHFTDLAGYFASDKLDSDILLVTYDSPISASDSKLFKYSSAVSIMILFQISLQFQQKSPINSTGQQTQTVSNSSV